MYRKTGQLYSGEGVWYDSLSRIGSSSREPRLSRELLLSVQKGDVYSYVIVPTKRERRKEFLCLLGSRCLNYKSLLRRKEQSTITLRKESENHYADSTSESVILSK